ncbi:Ubiquitin carboxyl-terminal hydrolase 14 [Mortierella sp. NVP85]|nr:Ubiquitin carboxyl-terminal hydrolase 14 [Mortierella sp. NVP85]
MSAATIKVNIKWGKEKYKDIEVDLEGTGSDLKVLVYSLTAVATERQKIIIKGKTLQDDALLSQFGLKEVSSKTMVELYCLEFSIYFLTPYGQDIMVMGSVGGPPKAPEKQIVFAEDMNEATLNKAMDIPIGLTNLGNTCYMNATLQCLRVVPELVDDLQKYTGGTNNLDAGSNMTASLRDLYKELNGAGYSVTPLVFLNYLRRAFPQFSQQARDGSWMQQDAEECWSQLISTLKAKLPPHVEGKENVVAQFMQGEFTTTLKCDEAPEEEAIVTTEPLLKVDCHISNDVNYLHNGILESLDQKIEKNSPTLGRSAIYSKTQRISRLPSYLTVNFVRFFWKVDEGVKTKILRKVAFPHELDALQFCTPELQAKMANTKSKIRDLDSAETALKRRKRLDKEAGRMETDEISDEQKAVDQARLALQESLDPELVQDVGSNPSGQYELAAVLTHIGRSADSGHYIGWTRKAGTDEWYKYDDDKVTAVTKDQIMRLEGGGKW